MAATLSLAEIELRRRRWTAFGLFVLLLLFSLAIIDERALLNPDDLENGGAASAFSAFAPPADRTDGAGIGNAGGPVLRRLLGDLRRRQGTAPGQFASGGGFGPNGANAGGPGTAPGSEFADNVPPPPPGGAPGSTSDPNPPPTDPNLPPDTQGPGPPLPGAGRPPPTPTDPGAVPEPSTWLMLIVGFGSVAAAMRRTRALRLVASV